MKCSFTLILAALLIAALPSLLIGQPEVEWQRSYGGEDEEYFFDLAQTTDGGFILIGRETSFGHPDPDSWIVKTDQDGEIQWTREYDGDQNYFFSHVLQSEDGGYLLGTRNASLLKTDDEGEIVWSRRHDFSNSSIIHTADGGYSLAGLNGENFRLMKLDEDAQEIWTCQFGGDESDYCYSHIQTRDGGFLLVGSTESFEAMRGDALLVKIDAEGEVEWHQTYGGRRHDYFIDVIQTEDNGYVMVGHNESISDGSPLWLLKTDEEGEVLWEYGDVNCRGSYHYQIFPARDGGFTLIEAYYYIGLFRANADGEELWSLRLPDIEVGVQTRSVTTNDGGYAIGFTDQNERGNLALLKISPDPAATTRLSEPVNPYDFTLLPVYPNPFNSTARIGYSLDHKQIVSLGIYDNSGSLITTLFNGSVAPGNYTAIWNASDMPAGIYFTQLTSSEGRIGIGKMLLVK
ncbi:MAG: T9SS type A sorting domain-containing protein [Candidatus Hatepunaea meridiana]|nr:T9SS type A sorting domain-containing protein [Candidatus Hatepunaea meridiana]